MKYIKGSIFSFLALILGFFGLSMLFSDLSQGETMVIRILVATLFFLISGAIIGFFNPTLWFIAGLTAWGGLLLGGLTVRIALSRYGADAFRAEEPPYIMTGLLMLIAPVTLSLIGGYIGKLISQRFAKTHLP